MATSTVSRVTISLDDPRSIRALDVLATADTWTRGHLKADGRPFYVIPSSCGTKTYWVDCRRCTCPDFERHQLPCKHVLACRMRNAQLRAPKGKRASVPAESTQWTATVRPTPPQMRAPIKAREGQTGVLVSCLSDDRRTMDLVRFADGGEEWIARQFLSIHSPAEPAPDLMAQLQDTYNALTAEHPRKLRYDELYPEGD